MRFVGGYDAFANYFDSLYFARAEYFNWDELNARAYYTILFDKNLKIKEVKIIKRLAYDNLKYNYDSLIKSILFITEGKWERDVSNKHKEKWSMTFGTIWLK